MGRETIHSSPWVWHIGFQLVFEVMVAYRLPDDPRRYYRVQTGRSVVDFDDQQVYECDKAGNRIP